MRLLFIICVFISTQGYSQAGTQHPLASHLDSLFSTKFSVQTPGVTVLVVRKGAIIYEKAFGSASLELNTVLTPSMLFDLGSITKQFTAVAVLQLVEQGKISLKDSIQRYIPGFPYKGYKITIENLLTHTSGIPDYMRLHPADPYLERKDFTPAEVIDTLKTKPLEFEPGTKFSYSNSGYFLLGYIIEKVSEESYHKYLEDHIFSPLGLQHTFYNLPGEVIPNHVNGYKNETGRFEKADFWSSTLPYAAGGLVSNVEDLYKWQLGLKNDKLLKSETLQKAFTSYTLRNGTPTDYGYGWYVSGQGNTLKISHGGAITGFRTSVLYYPNQDVFIALLCNCECTPVDDLAISVSDIVLGNSLQSDINLPDSILSRYVGTYFMTQDPKRIIVIQKNGDHLAVEIKGQGVFRLVFNTERAFELKGVLDLHAEFKTETGKITGFTVHQHGDYEWRKKG